MSSLPIVLIVDDDPIVRQILEALLHRQGYELMIAQDGVQALTLAQKFHPDLILLDAFMPDMDGFEVCRRLRANAYLTEVPIIMTTAADEHDVYNAGAAAGVDDFITKPFERLSLCNRVRTMVRLYGNRKQGRRVNEQTMSTPNWDEAQELEYRRQIALAELELAINQPHELQRTLIQTVKSVTSLLPATLGASIVLWDDQSARFTVSATTVPKQEKTSTARQVRRNGGASRWIVDHRKAYVEPDTSRPRIPANLMIAEFGVKAFVGMPLLEGNNCLGILYALEDRPRAFADEDLRFMQAAADRAAIAVSKVQAYEQLTHANEALARASRHKDEFLANMSHELRTPLNAILNLAEIMQEEVQGPLTIMQARSLDNMTSSGRHLLELINDILDLSKIEAGKMTVHMETVDVQTVCEASMTMVRQAAFGKGVQLHLKIAPTCVWIEADARQLRQMLVNLLMNGVKFTEPGGEVGLDVRFSDSGEMMRFCIWDTGIGIAQNDVGRLFQPFSQLDSGLDRLRGGTGLGLALVKRMAELHGGHVYLESEEGSGSRFVVELPPRSVVKSTEDGVDVAPVTMAEMRVNGKSEAQNVKLILLADDHAINAFAVTTFLESKGYRVIHALNGAEAVRLAQDERPDLILMDIQMPGMNGLDAITRIRASETRTRVPIIAQTALALDEDEADCLAAGADAYVTKPFQLRHLAAEIEKMLASAATAGN